MADYSKMKNAELESLLKERGMPHTGKKAELVKRLQDADQAGSKAEDEIDWDDEPATATAQNATSQPAAAALQAGGVGQPPNPQAVPNQVADIDPAKTDDLTVETAPEAAPSTTATSTAAPAADATTTQATAEISTEQAAAPEKIEKPAVDFSSGMKTLTIDQEIEKRKARAKKFGMDISNDEVLKNLERQKKFGGGDALPGKLNEALPEKRERKRGREVEDGGNQQKRGRPGMAGRRGSGRPQEGRSSTPRGGQANGSTPKPAPSSGLSEADKAKAEARKARFAGTT
ncbi:hypothetical protein MBLNU457_3719t1 [Dothideomycetes sp. NU457]